MSPAREPPALSNAVTDSQWIFTENELLRTPSILDGMTPEKERENRGKGVNFIFQVGIMLKLPQVTLATASVLLHRFYVRHSMIDIPGRPGFHYYSMAATSIFLATKIEEDCRKMRELVIACVRVAQKDPLKMVDEQDKEYWRWKDNILHNEDVLLEALCFDLTLDPPYKILFEYLNLFGESNNRRLRNSAWAFINDSCMTILCLMYSSRYIAASALYAAAKRCGIDIVDDEDGRPWWEVIDVELIVIKRACNFLATIYENAYIKNGRDVSIHESTPEISDESTAKTRSTAARSRETPITETSEGVQEPKKRTRSPDDLQERIIVDGQDEGLVDAIANIEENRCKVTNGYITIKADGYNFSKSNKPAAPQAHHDAVDDISEEGEVES
ncbi:MAG: hypothetical protein LQ341_000276 [Variospora aurantia]|nr:MAG: hypothetical protein LQ341_000276 [Variospora aurantia]